MVSDMPVEMTNEWPLPPFLLCGGYTENIAFVYIWYVQSWYIADVNDSTVKSA